MEFQSVKRALDAFQESMSPYQMVATTCHRAFDAGMEAVSVVELSGGLYNNTYQVGIGEDRARRPGGLDTADDPLIFGTWLIGQYEILRDVQSQ